MLEVEVRSASVDDSVAIAAIYDHHARHGIASFDFHGLTCEQWRDKIAAIVGRGWPFLVADVSGQVAGYAYAAQFRDRPGAMFMPARTASTWPQPISAKGSAPCSCARSSTAPRPRASIR